MDLPAALELVLYVSLRSPPSLKARPRGPKPDRLTAYRTPPTLRWDVAAVPLEGIRILAVDDDPDTLDFLCFVLEREGALVTCVDRPDEALARLKAATEDNRPHVLITDLAMPKKDGVWLIKAVRALPPDQGGDVPALALTAFTSQATADQLAEVGFQMRLIKPMDPAVLVDAVRTLAGRGVADPA